MTTAKKRTKKVAMYVWEVTASVTECHRTFPVEFTLQAKNLLGALKVANQYVKRTYTGRKRIMSIKQTGSKLIN